MSEYDMSIHGNPDAAAWARFFIETWKKVHPEQPAPDEGWMRGWFANAMMAMHDHLKRVASTPGDAGGRLTMADGTPTPTQLNRERAARIAASTPGDEECPTCEGRLCAGHAPAPPAPTEEKCHACGNGYCDGRCEGEP